MRLLPVLITAGSLAATAQASQRVTHGPASRLGIPKINAKRAGPVVHQHTGDSLPPYDQVYNFSQLIDHNDPSKGTFTQRYWMTWEWYKTGGPIILMTPGESNADGFADAYLPNSSINGMIAQQENGATIILEHRFFGKSNPYDNLSTASFGVHNIQQAIDDLTYFANNAKLPMPGGDAVTPAQAPWVLVGGSYSGALTAWTKVNSPDTFWAGYASSAVVETINDFWQYFQPVRENMPANCSADVQAVLEYIDPIWSGNNQTAINETLTTFGLNGISHLDDAAAALRNPLYLWQSLQPTFGPGQPFYEFCDALEVKDGQNAPEGGWGLDNALKAWGNYTKSQCDSTPDSCYGSYDANSTYYTSTAIDNADRSWIWFVCNEVGWYQESAPEGTPSIISRLLQAEYEERECAYFFPEKFSNGVPANTDATNTKYKGWGVNEPRLFFANGHRDPWREATVSAETQNIPSTDSQPIAIGDGFHCSDLLVELADDSIKAVQQQALASMKTWLADWKPANGTASR